jgi:glutamine amidotransferase
MLAVIDYGLGNLPSLCHALDRLDIAHCRTSDRALISAADWSDTPGVGAFPDGMANLRQLDLVDLLSELVLEKQRPVLGHLSGLSVMASEGREFEQECPAWAGWLLQWCA